MAPVEIYCGTPKSSTVAIMLAPAPLPQVMEIAAYMKANPSLQLGIDGSTNPQSTPQIYKDLQDSRVTSIRDALIAAGVPAHGINDGLFGIARLRRIGRVEVLIKSR